MTKHTILLLLATFFSFFAQGQKTKTHTISGYISDQASQETLIGAAVFSPNNGVGTATNSFGFYSLTLPAGSANLSVSYLGFETQTIDLQLTKDTLLNFSLHSNNRLEEITVSSVKRDVGIESSTMGAHNVSLSLLQRMPASLGEADIIKTLQLLPGVQAGTEGFSGMFVRGGGVDQNLIMLDGIPLYNADHLLGIFSVFTAEAVKSTTLYKSSFPARYGGRLSSIIDVRTNDGNLNELHGSVTLSPLAITEKLTLEGPIWKNHTSFTLSARAVPTIFLGKGIKSTDTYDYNGIRSDETDYSNYYFYDLNAKITHRFSDYDRLFLCYYGGRDHFTYSGETETTITNERRRSELWEAVFVPYEKISSDISWGNTVVYLRWNHVFSPRLFVNTTAAYNRYLLDIEQEYYNENSYQEKNVGNSSTQSSYRSGIEDISLRSEFNFTPSVKHNIRYGAEYLHHLFRPETNTARIKSELKYEIDQSSWELEEKIVFDEKTDSVHNLSASKPQPADEISVFVEDDCDLLPWLKINYGLRMSAFFTDGTQYFSPQPRLSARAAIGDRWAVKASVSRMIQYVHLLNATPFSMPTDLWVPVTKRVRPMTSDQYSVGGYYDTHTGWEFSIESYYKDMRNVMEYIDGASVFGSSTGWEDKVDLGKGRAYGVEFMIEKKTGKTTGWINYTLAKSELRFDNGSVNAGNWFPHRYDRRHAVNICLNQKLSERWDIGASWIFYTGGYVTMPERKTLAISPKGEIQKINYISSRNNYQLPSSHRLNIGFNYTKPVRRGTHVWNFSVYNAYCAKNASFVFSEYEDGVGTRVKKVTLLPLIPSITYTFRF